MAASSPSAFALASIDQLVEILLKCCSIGSLMSFSGSPDPAIVGAFPEKPGTPELCPKILKKKRRLLSRGAPRCQDVSGGQRG